MHPKAWGPGATDRQTDNLAQQADGSGAEATDRQRGWEGRPPGGWGRQADRQLGKAPVVGQMRVSSVKNAKIWVFRQSRKVESSCGIPDVRRQMWVTKRVRDICELSDRRERQSDRQTISTCRSPCLAVVGNFNYFCFEIWLKNIENISTKFVIIVSSPAFCFLKNIFDFLIILFTTTIFSGLFLFLFEILIWPYV